MPPTGLMILCKAFDIVAWDFLSSFLEFHDKLIYLMWIVQNNILSKKKNGLLSEPFTLVT